MKVINKIIISYFVFVLPILITTWLLLPGSMRSETVVGNQILEYTNTITGLLFSVWIVTALYVAISLIFSSRFRERLLTKIACMNERDEREEMIVGKAGRNVFLFNLAMLICIFMFNLILVNVSKLPPEKAIPGKEHNLYIGLNYEPFAIRDIDSLSVQSDNKLTIFRYSFPITVSGVLMILIMINISAFYVYTRRVR